jgi:S1-C subfamily serine protease
MHDQGQAKKSMDNLSASRKQIWQSRFKRGMLTIRRLLPFALGVLATFLALVLYNLLAPRTHPLSPRDVSQAINQALASATPPPAYSETVYRIIQPSLVLIEASAPNPNGQDNSSLGTGVIIDANADILTSLHVVTNTTTITVSFADGSQSGAKLISSDPSIDIAVLQPDQPPSVIVPAVLGNPNGMRVGDEAYAVGNPFGLYSSMSSGVISGFDRSFQPEGSNTVLRGMIQFDAAVNPGNSGGPLLNRAGQVIGIVTGIANPTDQNFFIGIGFAVPINVAGGAAGAPSY